MCETFAKLTTSHPEAKAPYKSKGLLKLCRHTKLCKHILPRATKAIKAHISTNKEGQAIHLGR